MTTITTRAVKGSPLTHNEVDANFTNLNTDKLDTAGIALGSAASPTIKFTGDPDTGIYSPGANQLAISTGGTERLRVIAAGNVGIGTTSPSQLLHVNGNVLVGGSPAAQWSTFTVAGDSAIQAVSPTLNFVNAAGSARFGYINHTGAGGDLYLLNQESGALRLGTGNAERLRIDSSGRLLVGTSSAYNVPTGDGAARSPGLQRVATTFADSSISSVLFNTASSGGGTLQLGRSNTTTIGTEAIAVSGDVTGAIYFSASDGAAQIRAAQIFAAVDGTPGANDMPGRLVFATTADGASSPTERLRIDSSGRVGIGTSSPVSALTVTGNASVNANSFYSSNIYFDGSNLRYIDNGYGGYCKLADNAGFISFAAAPLNSTGAGALASFANRLTISPTGTTEFLAAASTAPAVFKIAGGEVARIDSSGRLLVGTSSARSVGSGTASFFELETYTLGISCVRNTNDGAGGILALGKSRGTTAGAVTVVQDADILGEIRFAGADGTDLETIGAIVGARVDGTPGSNNLPTRLVFSTTADGTSSPTEQWRINNGGTVIYNQPAPAAVDATATLTVANLTSRIITSTTAAAVTMTLPTGTLMDGGFSGLYTNMAFEWSVINTGATNAVTVQAGSGHTLVGSGTVAANNSQRFLSRRTAANTWVTYRLT